IRGLLAALGHDVVADLLALDQRAHAGALDRADVHEHVFRAVGRRNESESLLGIEEFYGTCGHRGLLALYAVSGSDRDLIAGSNIRVLGDDLRAPKNGA